MINRKIDVLDIGTTLGKSEAMHKIDFMKVLPEGEDEFFKERQKQREEIGRQIDWLEWGATLSDQQKRYDLGRKIDVLDVGSELAKSEVWRSIDFLEMLPKVDESAELPSFENLGSREHYQ